MLPVTKTPIALPAPPKANKVAPLAGSAPATTAQSNSALKTLKAYRRAMGLCYKCTGKWSKDHRCPPEVLMAVETIWQDCPEQVFMAIFRAASQGATSTRAI